MPAIRRLPKHVEVTRAKGRAYYYVKVKGKRLAKLPGSPDTPEFHEAYALAMRNLAVDPKPQRHAENTVGWLIERYKASEEFGALARSTKVSYEHALKRLGTIGNHPVAQVKRVHIRTLRESIGDKARTAQLFSQVCSLLWNFGIEELEIETQNPARKMKRAGRARNYQAWTETEMERFETSNPPAHVMTAYMIARYVGPRREDISRLMRSDYDGATLKVAGTKTDTPTVVPVHPKLQAYLDQQPPTLYLVTKPNGTPVTTYYLSHAIRAHLDTLGFTHLHLHGLRHTAGVALAEAGCSSREIAAVLGHRTLQMVERYTKQAQQKRLAAAAIIKLQRK